MMTYEQNEDNWLIIDHGYLLAEIIHDPCRNPFGSDDFSSDDNDLSVF